MVWNAAYIHEFSLILQIILKSKLQNYSIPSILNAVRVLLATIHNKGLCSCPRCLMPKAQFDRMGLKPDMAFRLKNVQRFLSGFVASARDAIYKHVCSIGGSVIDRILKPTSSVPTVVSFCFYDLVYKLNDWTECLCR